MLDLDTTFRPVDVDAIWNRIKTAAERVIDGDDATSEDITRECREGRALCFASVNGVVIATLLPNRLRNDLELFVWLAVSWSGHGAFERCEPEIDTIARELGATRVVFHTRRRGWDGKLGERWRLRHVAYVKELCDGKQERWQGPGD